MKRRFSIVTLMLLSMSPKAAHAEKPLTACIDDRPWIPYTNPDLDHPGQMQILTEAALRVLGLSLQVTPLPWKRCQESLRSGKIDAMIGGGDVPYNRKLAEFPQSGQETDTSRSLGTARVMLVRRKGSTIDWNGQKFSGLTGPVGVAFGTQVIKNAVLKAKAIADEGAKTDDQNLRKLLQGRVDLMAAYEFDLKELLQLTGTSNVEILPVPLVETSYYLVFSKQYFARNRLKAESIWTNIQEARPQTCVNCQNF